MMRKKRVKKKRVKKKRKNKKRKKKKRKRKRRKKKRRMLPEKSPQMIVVEAWGKRPPPMRIWTMRL